MKKAVKDFFKADKDFEVVKIFENVFEGANAYVLKVGNDLVGAFEAGDEMTVDCHVR